MNPTSQHHTIHPETNSCARFSVQLLPLPTGDFDSIMSSKVASIGQHYTTLCETAMLSHSHQKQLIRQAQLSLCKLYFTFRTQRCLMKSYPLLPHRYQSLGWIVTIPALVAGIIYLVAGDDPAWIMAHMPAIKGDMLASDDVFFQLIYTDITDELIALALIAGLLMIGFSRERQEDELVERYRLDALSWAIWVSYGLLACCVLFIYGFTFLTVMIVNMFVPLLVFVLRFRWLLYRSKQALPG